MNDYRITYTSETGEESNIYVTERSEAAAKKSFLSDHKGMGFTVQSIELHRENTSATKQQERDTLAVIRKMVEELGPQSYLATAFEGCFEDAEQNIEDDAAYSMKARLEIQAQRAIERGHEVDRLKADLAAARSKVETLQGQFDFASQHIKKLERQQLPVSSPMILLLKNNLEKRRKKW